MIDRNPLFEFCGFIAGCAGLLVGFTNMPIELAAFVATTIVGIPFVIVYGWIVIIMNIFNV